MKNARIAALAGAVTLAFCGFVHATVVPADPSIAPSQEASATAGSDSVQAVVFAAGAGAQPAVHAGGAVQVAVNTIGSGLPSGASGPAQGPSGNPFSSYLISAGRYMLDVGSFSSRRAAAPKIPEVPLPGALWLFGTALLAFLAISGRRKF